MAFLAAAVMAAGAYAGSKLQADSAEEAAETSVESQERMFERGLEETQPYREFGVRALDPLQSYLDPNETGQMLRDYYDTDEYKAKESQMSESMMRALGRTGSLRGGAAPAAISRIAPQLGEEYLDKNYNRLMGLANIGITTSGGVPATAAQVGANIGQTQAAGINAAGQAQADLASDLTAIGVDYFGNI